MKSRHLIALIALSIATPAALAAEPVKEAAVESHTASKKSNELTGYAEISSALYKDDLAAAQKAATVCAKSEDEAFAKHAQAIADADDLAAARKHFNELSAVAVEMNKESKSLHQAHCPMANDGKGGDWLQTSADEVQNPYMGAKMPHCGKIAE